MCAVLLPPGVNEIADKNKSTNNNIQSLLQPESPVSYSLQPSFKHFSNSYTANVFSEFLILSFHIRFSLPILNIPVVLEFPFKVAL
jgi:hypothetical protein